MPRTSLLDLENLVYGQLDGNTEFYPQAEVDASINEGLRVLNLFTGFQQGSASITGGTDASRVYYDIPDAILYPVAVHLGGRQLLPSTVPAIAARFRDWMTASTAENGPTAYWIPFGTRKFAIYPPCSQAGVSLVVYGVLEPSELQAATDTVTVPDEFSSCLADLASHALQLKEGGAVFAAASVLYQSFLRKMRLYGRWRRLRQPRYFVEIQSRKEG